MRNKDLVERERQEREAGANATTLENQPVNHEAQPETQLEENGGGGRLFTQEEVNKIISERLARERAKGEPTAEEARAQELDARESRLRCRDYLDKHELPVGLLDVFDTSSYDLFVQSIEKLQHLNEVEREGKQRGKAPQPAKTADGLIRQLFGLN